MVSLPLRQPDPPTEERVTPSDSWWVGKSREQLRHESERRAVEMSQSRQGRKVQPLIVGIDHRIMRTHDRW